MAAIAEGRCSNEAGPKMIRVCDSCPWVKANHGKRHRGHWYTKANLRRLWNGLRTGQAPGMVCHSTDPDSINYGGTAVIKEQPWTECGGAVALISININALNAAPGVRFEDVAQPIQPPLTRKGVLRWLNRFLFTGVPVVASKFSAEELGGPEARP